MPYKEFPLLKKENLKTIPLKERSSLVDVKDFATPYKPGTDIKTFLKTLPNFLAGKGLPEFIGHLREAKKKGKPIILGMGAHPVKVGLNPILIDLMEKGWISAVAG
ncbi:MAG: hypothetical protein GY757_54545, partial [bacterium]|nr:hypothetical protein [bacterium]